MVKLTPGQLMLALFCALVVGIVVGIAISKWLTPDAGIHGIYGQ